MHWPRTSPVGATRYEGSPFVKRLARAATDYGNPNSLAYRFRARRIRPLLEMIEVEHGRQGHVELVDVGGTECYWEIVPTSFLDEHDVTISIVNLPSASTPPDHGRFKFIFADGCELGLFADDAFDIAHSNSVIEHVGEWGRMRAFAEEIKRVAPNYFLQTPNYWFPVEPHFVTPFFHWLPKRTRIWLIRHMDLGQWSRQTSYGEAKRAIESAHLLSRKDLGVLFEDADIMTERVLGLAKSLIAIRTGHPPEESGS